MNIAIIEKDHFEVANTLIELFDNGDNQIMIFIDKKSYQQLPHNKHNWIVREENESRRQFAKRIFEYLHSNNFDLVYLNTVDDNFITYAHNIDPKKTVLTLHSINDWFSYTFSFSLRRWARYIGKKRLIEKIQSFNVLSCTMIPALQQKIGTGKKIYNISGSIFDPSTYSPLSLEKTINITVPGSIDMHRRDYDAVFELLSIANKRGIDIAITLLGSFHPVNGRYIQHKCHEYKMSHNNLHFYSTDIVDQSEFDRVMKQTHFIWVPLQRYMITGDSIREEYGRTICSGNIGDVIKYAKPFFIPGYVAIDNKLDKACIKYSSVTEILNFEDYDKLQQAAYEVSMQYTKEKILPYLPHA